MKAAMLTNDEIRGMTWWNSMTEAQRYEVMAQANRIHYCASVKQAFEMRKAGSISVPNQTLAKSNPIARVPK